MNLTYSGRTVFFSSLTSLFECHHRPIVSLVVHDGTFDSAKLKNQTWQVHSVPLEEGMAVFHRLDDAMEPLQCHWNL